MIISFTRLYSCEWYNPFSCCCPSFLSIPCLFSSIQLIQGAVYVMLCLVWSQTDSYSFIIVQYIPITESRYAMKWAGIETDAFLSHNKATGDGCSLPALTQTDTACRDKGDKVFKIWLSAGKPQKEFSWWFWISRSHLLRYVQMCRRLYTSMLRVPIVNYDYVRNLLFRHPMQMLKLHRWQARI